MWHRIWEKVKSLLLWGVSIATAFIMVMKAPAVAIGFMALSVSKLGPDQYMQLLLTAGASVFAAMALVNLAEIAVVWTAYGVHDAMVLWSQYVEKI